jgi:hypothetical protein
MSKAYTMVRADLADEAAVQAVVDENPTSYTTGTTIVDAAGARHVIISNDGTTVVLGLVTVS